MGDSVYWGKVTSRPISLVQTSPKLFIIPRKDVSASVGSKKQNFMGLFVEPTIALLMDRKALTGCGKTRLLRHTLRFAHRRSRIRVARRMRKKAVQQGPQRAKRLTVEESFSEAGSTGGDFPFAKIHSTGERPHTVRYVPPRLFAYCGLACGTARPWAKRLSWQPQGGRVK